MTIYELQEYILRRLGHPVINIEIDSSQLEDCINEATDKFIESHYDGTNISYIATDFIKDQTVYILDSTIQSVVDILKTNSLLISDEPLLLTLPMRLGDYDSPFVDLTEIEVFRQNIKNIDSYFAQETLFDFNSTTKKLILAVPPEKNEKVILKVFKSEIPNDAVYDNLWFKKYATALAKIQWGSNLSKYSGATLPGGVQINGQEIKSDGYKEKEDLEIELQEMYSDPPDFMIG